MFDMFPTVLLMWLVLQVIRPETCSPCGKRIRFGKMAVKCRNCRAVAHPECKQKFTDGCSTAATAGGSAQQVPQNHWRRRTKISQSGFSTSWTVRIELWWHSRIWSLIGSQAGLYVGVRMLVSIRLRVTFFTSSMFGLKPPPWRSP